MTVILPDGSWWDWDVISWDPGLARAPTADELRTVAAQLGETPALVVTFEADAGGPTPMTCLVAAGRLEVVPGTVLRYWREELRPGERLAPWGRPT